MIEHVLFFFKREWHGLEHASMARRESETQRVCKRDRPIDACIEKHI
jgi:hypothetical protein